MLQIFQNPQFGDIRIATDENGNPLFCLADLCTSLNLTNSRAVAQRLDSEDKCNLDLHLPGQKPTFVTESGMYTVILRSDSPKAKPMQKWVTNEILPTIRKHGMYATANTVEKMLSDPDATIKLLQAIKEERAEKERLRIRTELQAKELKESAPKVAYYEEVLQSKSDITTTVIAKELGMGAESLNKLLHAKGVIFKSSGIWVLYSKYQNMGFTHTRTFPYTDSHGTTKTAIHTYWTEKGREFIHELMK